MCSYKELSLVIMSAQVWSLCKILRVDVRRWPVLTSKYRWSSVIMTAECYPGLLVPGGGHQLGEVLLLKPAPLAKATQYQRYWVASGYSRDRGSSLVTVIPINLNL